MSKVFFLKSKVREFIKSKDLKVAKDVVNGKKLNLKIQKILEDAVIRAKENGRKTLMEKDI